MAQQYNDPRNGQESSIGTQLNDFFYQKKALIESRKKQVFMQLSTTIGMPKHMGKEIQRYVYLPILDDANINDQGIDANGVTTTREVTIEITRADEFSVGNGYVTMYAVGEGANDAAALVAAKARAVSIFKEEGVFDTDYDTTVAALRTDGWTIVDDNAAVPVSGNLYGSSKDIGKIVEKLPVLGENGGRVNRVGTKRIEIKGEIENLGFFDEYTRDSVQFDTDSELRMHVNREMVNAAVEISEDALQIDLLNGAGVVRYGGEALSDADISGEDGATASEITYEDLMKLSIDLDDNRCPKHTKIITGTTMVDTKTINGARYIYIGSELKPMYKRMVDSFGNPAFVSVEKYAGGTTIAEGEIGCVDEFRIVIVPEMLHWAGKGKEVTNNGGYREVNGKYNVYPSLVIGDESFVTIGFQTDGKTVKFEIIHKAPGKENADRTDPYGKTGFMSIQWWYGTMILRPERIALLKSVAEW